MPKACFEEQVLGELRNLASEVARLHTRLDEYDRRPTEEEKKKQARLKEMAAIDWHWRRKPEVADA